MKNKLIDEARKVAGNFELNTFDGNSAGVVASALLADNDKIYTGINMNLQCGLGFCAESSAVSQMLKDRVTKIKMIVAVIDNGKILPPCGRCREMLMQIDKENENTDVVISETKIVKLKDILPYNWMNSF